MSATLAAGNIDRSEQQESGRDRQALLYHGGNLAVARRLWTQAPQPWLDLSTGINARPYPVGDIPAEAWTRLPEPALVADLEEAAAGAYGLRSAAEVVAAPGSQAQIQALPRLVPARRVAILGFTYAEHGRVWRNHGASVHVVHDAADLAEADLAIVVNPNNPDGRLVPAGDLVSLARRLRARGGTLVVDEAFADVLGPQASVAPHAAEEGIVVLRSFGKTYGLAGLRLGFLVGPPSVVEAVRAAQGPWAVSGPAGLIGVRAFRDTGWLEATRVRLARDGARLDAMLQAGGLALAGGTPLFRLVETPRAAAVFEALAGQGVLVRPFAERPRWLRLGLPGGDGDWAVLERRLGAALAG